MSSPRTGRRRAGSLVLALATGAASTCVLGLTTAAPALAETAPVPPVAAGLTDADARAGAVAAIVHDDTGRPTFVEVAAPTVAQAVRRAADLPGSDGVAVDTPVRALGTVDPLRSRQWSLDALRVDRLPVATGRSGHLVAVVDTGVRAGHEDFARGQVRCDLGADFTGERAGGNGCTDPQGHGTHVAGIIGAVTGNGTGVASIASGTALLPVRVLDSSGSGGSLDVAKGIVHAADKGAKVINLSLGGPGRSTALDAAVKYATDRGALVVAAAGNNRTSGNEVNYPAASPGALSVASTERTGLSSSFSYYGPSVDLAAPGGAIPSTWGSSDSAYATASGTSMAAPAVSAVASLYRATHPTLTPAQLTAALQRTAIDLETAGRDDRTGAGLVNPLALLGGTAAPAPVAPTPVRPAPVTRPAPSAPVVRAPAPRAQVLLTRLRPGQQVPFVLSDYRPASTVSVLETYIVTQRVPVRTAVRSGGRIEVRTRWVLRRTARTVLLGAFRVREDGTVRAQVLPLQGVRTGTLVVRGFDRAAKVVERTAPLQVG